MLDKISYKSKVWLLLACFVLMLILVYQLAIKSTLIARQQFKELKQKEQYMQTAPAQIVDLEQKLVKVNAMISSSEKENKNLHELILEKIGIYCQEHRLTIREYPQSHNFDQHEYILETNRITIEGSFIRLLKLLHYLEVGENIGRVMSVQFKGFFDRKLKRDRLQMTLFIQSISKK